ncbi:MAG TPA: aconitate hydratase AcnA [Thermodesulfobacteriota bacterium]|nr:aconitate hydratase AcnA [Thermodesulfobacteriota bacterium]
MGSRQPAKDSFGSRATLAVGDRSYEIYRLDALARAGVGHVDRLPFSLKILLENLLRHEDGRTVREEDIAALAAWDPARPPVREIAFRPARVLMQDFTGVPALVDLAAMRDALKAMGGDPARINPLQPTDLIIDHSVQVDSFGSAAAFVRNVQLEFERNRERYAFLRWGQRAFRNFRVVPPGTGICHQVNLEYLARTVWTAEADGRWQAYPDTLVGTDSHTTMINGLAVVGWGVGGIEAEAAMLGQPIAMLVPEVVGVRLHGRLREGVTATDLVLTVTQMLRARGVVGKFVEFFGRGLSELSVADRATIANMCPEYGATIAFFPADAETLAYLRFTGRPEAAVRLVEAYCKTQGLFRTDDTPDPLFSETLELDLGTVEPSLAGPRRPQDRVPLAGVRTGFFEALPTLKAARKGGGTPATGAAADGRVEVVDGRQRYELSHGSVVIAAITSCTNTSNPSVMLGAGLLARKAVQRGLRTRPWVKTSLAPGSRVVTDYLRAAGLVPYLEALGFHLVGYGCTTCIGNSGALPPRIAEAIRQGELVVAAVLSGNRNFEGRINPLVRANYLASPPLVVAYALAGHLDVDLTTDPVGYDPNGEPVYLRDIWPSEAEVREAIRTAITPEMFRAQYATVTEGDPNWRELAVPEGVLFAWDPASTYVRRPPYFDDLPREPQPPADIRGARVLAVLGDSITTDHISPAGSIPADSPAGRYLVAHGVQPADFNSYGARRGNHEVMVRGTFANVRLRNLLAPGTEGGLTRHLPDGALMPIYDAAVRYQAEGVPLVVLAGKEYGAGSSRDWAAKGPRLLGVRAVLAESFERIHRSNLVGMGVLPLEFLPGDSRAALGLSGEERYDIEGIAEGLSPGKRLVVTARPDGGGPPRRFEVRCRIDTPQEVDYYRHGGILPYVLRQLLQDGGDGAARLR